MLSVPAWARAQEPAAPEPSGEQASETDAESEPDTSSAAEPLLIESPSAPAAAPDLSARDPAGVPTTAQRLSTPVLPLAPVTQERRWSPVFTGSFFTRYELRRGYDDLNLNVGRARFVEGDAMFYRARFGVGTGLFDVGRALKVGLQFTPQASGTFGENGPNTIVDAQLGLHEGYARVQGKYARFDAGRFEMVYGDALMIGNNDWSEVGRTFDGVRARIGSKPEAAWLDLFASVVDEGRPEQLGVGQGDLWYLGAYAALGPLTGEALDLDLYVLSRVWGEQKDVAVGDAGSYRRAGANETTVGVRSKARIGKLDYRVETGVQTGTRPGITPTVVDDVLTSSRVARAEALAYQVDLELGATFWNERARAAVEALYATGDHPGEEARSRGWQDPFSSAHKWLGLADAFSQNGFKRTNVASGVVHVTARPFDMLTFQLDAHLFARPQPELLGGQAGLAGGELDMGVVYMLADGLKLRALYALFTPSSRVFVDHLPTLGGSPDPAHYFEAELRYDLLP